MLWGSIIDDKLYGPFRVPYEFKLTSKSYIEFLIKNFLPIFEKFSKQFQKKISFYAR